MKNLQTISIALMLLVTFKSSVIAQTTYDDIQKLALEFTSYYIQNVYDGGINQRVFVDGYHANENKILINVDMSWNGDIITTNHYKDNGTIIIEKDRYGNITLDYKSYYRNQTASDYRVSWDVIYGGAVALAVLDELSK